MQVLNSAYNVYNARAVILTKAREAREQAMAKKVRMADQLAEAETRVAMMADTVVQFEKACLDIEKSKEVTILELRAEL